MKLLSVFAGLLTAAHIVYAINSEDIETFEALPAVPEGWQYAGTPDAGTRMRFTTAMTMVRTFVYHNLFN